MSSIPCLYAIVDEEAAAARGWSLRSLSRACIEGGATLVQLRAKRMASGELLRQSEAVWGDATGRAASVVINDRADVARLLPGAGVHVGQDDLPPALARRIVGPGPIVGVSTHTHAQIEAALREPITYVAVGPVFHTRTKDTGYDQVGLDLVRYAAAAARSHSDRAGTPPIPVVAIGGITLDTARSVIDAGATSVAVISDLLVGDDPAARVRGFLERLVG